jgi:hypothetical protein
MPLPTAAFFSPAASCSSLPCASRVRIERHCRRPCRVYKGQTVQVFFVGTEDASLQTTFLVDDVALTVQ